MVPSLLGKQGRCSSKDTPARRGGKAVVQVSKIVLGPRQKAPCRLPQRVAKWAKNFTTYVGQKG